MSATNAKENSPKDRIKLVWDQAVGQVSTTFTTVEQDARTFASKVEETGRKRISTIKDQLQVGDLLEKSGIQAVIEQGRAVGLDSLEKINAKKQLDTLTGAVESITARFDGLLTREEGVSKTDLEAVQARLAKVEEALKVLRKPVAKKPAAKKPAAKKPVAKNAAPKKTASKKPAAKKAAPKKSSAKK